VRHEGRAAKLRIAGVTTVERAYQLAQAGQCQSLTEIKKRLHDEGFVDATAQLNSRTLTIELRRLISGAGQELDRRMG
jgi:hypothetical protein